VKGLYVQRYIGAFRRRHERLDEENERHVFLLATEEPLPERWEHSVSGGGEDNGLRFAYYWLDTAIAALTLTGNQGDYLHYLVDA
jgi:hypothetical protein